MMTRMKTILAASLALASLAATGAEAETQIVWRSTTTGKITATGTGTPTSPTSPGNPTDNLPINVSYFPDDRDVPVGKPLSMVPSVSGNAKAPLHFKITDGLLPAGLMLNTSTGQIQGIPVNTGVYFVQLEVSDAAGRLYSFRVFIQVI